MGSELSGNRLRRGAGLLAVGHGGHGGLAGFVEVPVRSVPIGTVKVSSDCKRWHTLTAGARNGVHPRFVLLNDGTYWRLRRGGTTRLDYAQVTERFIEMASKQSWFDKSTVEGSVGYSALPTTPPAKKRKQVV